MNIKIRIPFRLDKDLGKAYNDEFAGLELDDWLCLIDYDVTFLTPRSIPIMYEYATKYPNTGIFTCFTNRIHPLAVDQLFTGEPSDETNFSLWQMLAIGAESDRSVTEIKHPISGFLMMIKKRTWMSEKFFEGQGCLGVDNDYSARILQSGRKILRMNGLLVWHSYRLANIKDKSHLL